MLLIDRKHYLLWTNTALTHQKHRQSLFPVFQLKKLPVRCLGTLLSQLWKQTGRIRLQVISQSKGSTISQLLLAAKFPSFPRQNNNFLCLQEQANSSPDIRSWRPVMNCCCEGLQKARGSLKSQSKASLLPSPLRWCSWWKLCPVTPQSFSTTIAPTDLLQALCVWS